MLHQESGRRPANLLVPEQGGTDDVVAKIIKAAS